MVKYTGINHLAMVTIDMDKTIRYWRDLLGMRLVAGLGDKKYRHYFFEISETDLIAFFEWPEGRPAKLKDHGVPTKDPVVFDHVSIGVNDVNDLIELKRKLSAADFWVSEIIDHGFILSIYSFDPNNIPVEFSCAVPEVNIRSHPKMIDKFPLSAAREGADLQPGKWPAPDKRIEAEEDNTIYPGDGRALIED